MLGILQQALAQARMNSLMQLSRALNDARVEKEAAVAQAVAHTKAEKMEAAADERQEQLIKVLHSTNECGNKYRKKCLL